MADNLDALIDRHLSEAATKGAATGLDALIDQHLERSRSKPGEEPGRLESLARGAGQGVTFGFGEEAGALLGAAGRRLLPESMGGDAAGSERGFGDVYREERDALRGQNAAAQAAHPGYYLTGNVLGGLPTAALMPGAGGFKVLRAAGAAKAAAAARAAAVPAMKVLVKTGAALGGLNALGNSTEDLTQPTLGGVAKTAGEVALGAGAGAAIPQVLKGTGYVLKKAMASVAPALGTAATWAARKVLTGGSKAAWAQGLPKEAVQAALKEGAIWPVGTTAGAAERLAGVEELAGEQYGRILQALEAKGVSGPSAHRLAAEIRIKARARKLPMGEAWKLFEKAANELPEGYQPGEKLALSKAEQIKRLWQSQAREYYRAPDAASELVEGKADLASAMRNAIETEVEAQAQKAPEEAAAFIPAKQSYANVTTARDAAERAARAAPKAHSLLNVMAATGELAHTGSPLKALGAAAGLHLLRTRGPSTAAWTAYQLGRGANAAASAQLPGLVARGVTTGGAAATGLSAEDQERIQAYVNALRARGDADIKL